MKLKLLYFLPLFLFLIPVVNAGISFQPSVIEDIRVTMVDGAYVVSYLNESVTFTPYLVLNGKETTNLMDLYNEPKGTIKPNYVLDYLKEDGKQARLGRGEVDRIEWGYQVNNISSEKSRVLSECGYEIQTNIKKFELFEGKEWVKDRWVYVKYIEYPYFTIDFSELTTRYETKLSLNKISIINLDNPTKLDLDPITYSSPFITVTGYNNPANPCTFWDLWNASSINGWNVSSQTSENTSTGLGYFDTQYVFDCRILIGNDADTTYFNDTEVQVTFTDTAITSNGHYFMKVNDHSVAQFGEIEDETYHSSKNGCAFKYLEDDRSWDYLLICDLQATVNTYSSFFQTTDDTVSLYHLPGSKDKDLWNCMFSGESIGVSHIANADVFNVFTNPGSYGIRRPEDSTVEQLRAISVSYAVWFQDPNVYTIRDLYARDIGTDTFRIDTSNNNNQYVIDADLPDPWTLRYVSGTNNGELYRQYTFNLEVKNSTGYPIENATCTLVGADGHFTPFIVNTTADGTITEQTVSRGFYNQTGGDTLYDYGPFHLQVTHSTGTADIQNITLSAPVDWEITIPEPSTGGGMAIWLAALLLGSIAFLGVKKK